ITRRKYFIGLALVIVCNASNKFRKQKQKEKSSQRAGYRLQRKLQVQKTKAKGKKQSTVCEDAASAKRPRSVGV
ncbi:unnamed protein product, partial [Porites evermanni]